MHPRLSPGLHVLRRRDGRLQVGLDSGVVLPDTVDLRRELRQLEAGQLPDPDRVPEPVRPLLRRPDRPVRARVAVTGFGHPAGAELPGRLRTLLKTSGLAGAQSSAAVAVLVGVGEPTREQTDGWHHQGVPHMLVRLVEGYAVIGPFVVPGRTACLRCIDATLTDDDSSWPVLLEQYTRASSRDRVDGLAEPMDPALAELACAWAARDVLSYLQGHRPSTWSATLRLDPLLHDLRTTSWLRHPECGCAWTMEA